jgi:hypothetical protein
MLEKILVIGCLSVLGAGFVMFAGMVIWNGLKVTLGRKGDKTGDQDCSKGES